MNHRTFLRCAALAGISAGGLPTLFSACGEASSGRGSGEVAGTLNVLNLAGWPGPTTYADFAKANPGARVSEVAWVSADESVTKAKDRAGDIDPLLVDGTTFPRLAAIKALAELGDVPNLARVAAQHKGNAWDPDDIFFAPTDHGRTGIIYRRNPLSEQIESWADFAAAAPSHRGKVVVPCVGWCHHLRPAIVASALLIAAFSFDAVARSLALRGPGDTTLTVYVLSATQRCATPAISAIGAAVMTVGLGALCRGHAGEPRPAPLPRLTASGLRPAAGVGSVRRRCCRVGCRRPGSSSAKSSVRVGRRSAQTSAWC
jgi:hypothetical protein